MRAWLFFSFNPVHWELWRSRWEPLTMLEGFQGEPEEDDGVEEAVQTMGPEDLQNRGKRGGGEGRGEEWGVVEWETERVRQKKKKACERVWGAPGDPWPGPFVQAQHWAKWWFCRGLLTEWPPRWQTCCISSECYGGERGYPVYVLAMKSKWMTSMFGF